MAEMNRRSRQRNRHREAGRLLKEEKREAAVEARRQARAEEVHRRADEVPEARAGVEEEPGYGKTHVAERQPKGGQAPYERQTYGAQGSSDEPEAGTGDVAQAGEGGGVSGFGREYGQGFGVGAGHGVEGVGSPREREYRGDAGTTFGAVVGPDALKSEEADKRPDEKPEK